MQNEEKKTSLPTQECIQWIESRLPQTVMGALNIRMESYDPERVVAVTEVSERLFQPAGVVHGGVYVLLAETVASIASALRINIRTHYTVGMEINANHLRPVTSGTLRAIATCLHEGRTSHVFHIDVVDEQDRRVCVSRCTMAIRPHESSLK